MKKIVIVLFIFMVIPFTSYGEEVINNFRGIRWGMTREEVNERIKQLDLKVFHTTGNEIIVADLIFNQKAQINFVFPPPSHRLLGVVLKFASTQIFNDLNDAIAKKYGSPARVNGIQTDWVSEKKGFPTFNSIVVKKDVVTTTVTYTYNNLLVDRFEVEPDFEGGRIKEENLDKF